MYSKIFKWTSWILIIISFLILVWGFLSGWEGGNGAKVDVLLRWAYILLIVAVVAAVLAAIVISGLNNPKGLIKGLIGIAVVLALCYVVYLMSSDAPLVGYLGDQPSANTLKLSTALLNITYIVGGCAILSILVGEVVSAFRKK
jgi:hypothetical protein